jgi:hypothetical protein
MSTDDIETVSEVESGWVNTDAPKKESEGIEKLVAGESAL